MPKVVEIDYVPRPWQANFEKNIGDKKRAFLLWARRHGKDIACWNYLILKAITRRGSYYYLYPRQNQARKAIWEGMTSSGKRFLDYIPKELLAKDPNNSEMQITLINGSIIRILGSDNHDALRSSNPIGVVFSEYAFHHPHTWTGVIEPILQENGGWALFNTTPFGRNHAHDLWKYAIGNPETWYTEKVTNEQSGIVSAEEIEEMKKRGVSEETIRQEYFCDFDRGVDGAYYGRILTQLRLDDRLTRVPRDDYALVHTAWDLGFGDSTSIWFYQLCGNNVNVIDYYEAHGENIPHYVTVLEEKSKKFGYKYGTHYFPHDAAAGNMVQSKAGRATELGLKNTILAREGIDTGIERCRKYLPKCFIDTKNCEYGIKCLDGYRKTFNEKLNVYSDTPLHDWASHGADAFRYMCQAIETHHSGSSYSLEQHRELKMKYGVGRRETSSNSILGN